MLNVENKSDNMILGPRTVGTSYSFMHTHMLVELIHDVTVPGTQSTKMSDVKAASRTSQPSKGDRSANGRSLKKNHRSKNELKEDLMG